MVSYEGFKEKYYPHKKQLRPFTPEEIRSMEKEVPQDVIDFLVTEGVCSYMNNFMWTALPLDFHEILTAWGVKGNKCYTFMRSAFGACIFYSHKEYFYLDPLEGRIISLGDDFYFTLNYMIRSETILENGFFENYFNALSIKKDDLQEDEVFAFVPALPIGGSIETSKIERVKMKEHLLFLAQLFDGKAQRI